MYQIKSCNLNDLPREWRFDISKDAQINGVFLGDNPVGYGNIVEDYYKDGRVSWCGGCFIDESHRGKGLQKKLLELRIEQAKKLGRIKMITSHIIDNEVSRKNLLLAGFKDTYKTPSLQYMELVLKSFGE